MRRLIDRVACLWRVTVAGLMLAVTLLTLAQVIARYVFNSSLIWSEELNRLLFVWLVLIAAVGASHMRIDLLTDRCHLETLSKRIGLIAGLVSLGLIGWGALQLQTMFALDRYITLGISKTWYFAAAIVSAALWAVTLIYQSLEHKKSEGGGAE